MPLKIQIKIKNYGLKADEEERRAQPRTVYPAACKWFGTIPAATHEKFIIIAITE